MAREVKRINNNMPIELVVKIDEYAEKMCISRSSAINVLCSMALESQKGMSDIGELIELIKKGEVKK